ncbi:hypothetical protein, partial [Roseinatronobacter monicus]|uniref:hypothetical protein n=1 Tax=Roseinatronobacter monicus TaxID=393481 RepID=UPI003F31B4D0
MEDLTPILGRLDRIEALLSGPKITPEYLDTQGAAEFIGLSKLTLGKREFHCTYEGFRGVKAPICSVGVDFFEVEGQQIAD